MVLDVLSLFPFLQMTISSGDAVTRKGPRQPRHCHHLLLLCSVGALSPRSMEKAQGQLKWWEGWAVNSKPSATGGSIRWQYCESPTKKCRTLAKKLNRKSPNNMQWVWEVWAHEELWGASLYWGLPKTRFPEAKRSCAGLVASPWVPL